MSYAKVINNARQQLRKMQDWRATAKQSIGWHEYLQNDEYTRILFDGASRSGKTDLILHWLVVMAEQYPGLRILAARKRLAHAKKTTLVSLNKILNGMEGWSDNKSDFTWTNDNGSVIIVDGLDDKERVDKILGDEYGIIFINESTQVSWGTIQTLMTRLSQMIPLYPRFRRKLILDCNPKSRRHFIHRLCVDKKDPESNKPLRDAHRWGRLNWTVWDNTYLPEDYFDTLSALPEVMRKRMRDGIWCDNEGAVYEEFDEDVHVCDPFPIPREWQVFRSIDFGYTNPFVCLWGAVDEDGRIYICDEHYKDKMLIRNHALVINIKSRGKNIQQTVADHDAQDRAELVSHGIATTAAKKAVSKGIQAVKKRLIPIGDGKPRLYIFSSCKNLIQEFYEYKWPEGKEGHNDKEEPVKEHDHAMDALRYLIVHLDGTSSLTW
jgi:PBSX family phage terminase large subunit